MGDCGCGNWDGGQSSEEAGACGNCGMLPWNPWGLALLLSGGSLESLLLDDDPGDE